MRTKLISEALSLGIPAAGGLYMLVAQAVRASELFLGKSYEKKELWRVFEKTLREKENIVLIGMPSSGKTTIAKELSKLLSREAYDSDEEIEKAHGKITDIFKNEGEQAFRDYETEAIKALSSKTGVIIATGGGAILREENVKALKRNGKIVFLNRALEDLTPTASRPLSSDFQALRQRFEERLPIYESVCDLKLDVTGTPEELAIKIKEMLSQ